MSVEVIGTGMSPFGVHMELRLSDLASAAADAALLDAGVSGKDIGLVVFGNAAAGLLTGQEMIRAHVALSRSAVAGRPMVSVENACASSSSAFHLGTLAVSSGAYDHVLVVGAEKMSTDDRSRARVVLGTALDVERDDRALRSRSGEPVFMEIYAAEARTCMDTTGATPRDFACVAEKNFLNGSLNPLAQHRTPMSVDEILEARMIVDPLTRPMCSSIGDGAAAVVLARSDRASGATARGPRVLASVVGSGKAGDQGDVVARTGRAAFEQAGVGPKDLDLCEVHDAAASAELVIAKELGLAPDDDVLRMTRSGATRIGGKLPINPSGGLLARGHPVGATGLAQIVELSDHLRGRAGRRQVPGARIGLAENAGGSLGSGPAACVVTILASA